MLIKSVSYRSLKVPALWPRYTHSTVVQRSSGDQGVGLGKFADREKAAEDQWARQDDAEKLKAFRHKIEEEHVKTEKIRDKVEDLKKKHKK
ncbi:uncharacterized protein BYT42DRAFT_610559 [Radiomyces spectabilis]|uniref:uncharacterized protein n=1 Tax=Radiomyces spectabilis TaxID=64574 RepID=UPI0022200A20|nr:uncharacterized protein BYT42DRAFT_610559 [Radiomyces spectabilis]KAI8391316.1 hypothetical protein BYT42DRAFT_610559 [Radiomyces spectabilis]